VQHVQSFEEEEEEEEPIDTLADSVEGCGEASAHDAAKSLRNSSSAYRASVEVTLAYGFSSS
jgi:hypothetical protein